MKGEPLMSKTTSVLLTFLFLLLVSPPVYAFNNYIDSDMRSAFDTEANGRITIANNYDYNKI